MSFAKMQTPQTVRDSYLLTDADFETIREGEGGQVSLVLEPDTEEVQSCTVLYCTVLYCVELYCSALCCAELCCELPLTPHELPLIALGVRTSSPAQDDSPDSQRERSTGDSALQWGDSDDDCVLLGGDDEGTEGEGEGGYHSEDVSALSPIEDSDSIRGAGAYLIEKQAAQKTKLPLPGGKASLRASKTEVIQIRAKPKAKPRSGSAPSPNRSRGSPEFSSDKNKEKEKDTRSRSRPVKRASEADAVNIFIEKAATLGLYA
jgi:hypothetical protein